MIPDRVDLPALFAGKLTRQRIYSRSHPMARKGGTAHPGTDVANAVAKFPSRSLAIADELVLPLPGAPPHERRSRASARQASSLSARSPLPSKVGQSREPSHTDRDASESAACTEVPPEAGTVIISPLVLTEVDHLAKARFGPGQLSCGGTAAGPPTGPAIVMSAQPPHEASAPIGC
jgi:hypothetical protein